MVWKHGASAYRNGMCRCKECRAGNRDLQNRGNARRRSERTLIDGRLVAPLPAERHGKYTTYAAWGCQCEPCREVGREVNRRNNAKRRGAAA